jgi:hypothetical protein
MGVDEGICGTTMFNVDGTRSPAAGVYWHDARIWQTRQYSVRGLMLYGTGAAGGMGYSCSALWF